MHEINFDEFNNILVVAPHADDETIGCGGILLTCGYKTDVMLLTDGRKGAPHGIVVDEEELANLRKEEFRKAMVFANIRKTIYLGIPDKEVSNKKKEICQQNIKDYDAIFVPNRNEAHKDHIVLYKIFSKMKKKQKAHAKLIEYEIWTPLLRPNLFVDITQNMRRKVEMLSFYETQLVARDYVGLCEGLNRYRGALCKMEYAENYYEQRPVRLRSRIVSLLPDAVVEKIYNILLTHRR